MCCVRCDFRSHSDVAKLLVMFNFRIFKGCVLVVLVDTVKRPAGLYTEYTVLTLILSYAITFSSDASCITCIRRLNDPQESFTCVPDLLLLFLKGVKRLYCHIL